MKLDKWEKGLLKSIEKGEYKKLPDSEKQRHVRIVKDHLRKNATITFRISKTDLAYLKKFAEKEGIPYQTLLTSILHKYLSKSLIDIDDIEKIKKVLAA